MTEWHGCYADSWQGIIEPDAFAHPAKFARGLIRRIYQHMLDRGYIERGGSVVDPFGGVALGGLDAMTFGLHWQGIELESRFVTLGNANIDKWTRDLAMLNGTLGTARLVQGDSRKLAEIVGAAAGCVTSPPYAGANGEGKTTERDNRRLTEMGRYDLIKRLNTEFRGGKGYGTDNPGQLGTMRNGDFDSAISSPPYADAVNGQGEGPGARHDPIHHNGDNAFKQSSANGYGTTPGNLGSMAGVYDGTVTSPPYEASFSGTPEDVETTRARMAAKGFDVSKIGPGSHTGGLGYGSTDGQLGSDTPDNFWSAARLIMAQTYSVLKPGGYAAFVCKDFVRNGQRVPFSDQWEQLCAAVGFESIERIRAMLVDDHGDQMDIFGGVTARRKERKSFFRRLAEKKGSPRIDHEDVIIMRRPIAANGQGAK